MSEKKTVASGDALKARREKMKAWVSDFFTNSNEELHLGGVVKKWEEATKTKHDNIVWYDILHGIEACVKEGTVTVSTPDKGRTKYKAVAKPDDGTIPLPLEFKD